MKTLALILAGGRGSRLDILSDNRAKPSVPFAGKFRLIDFALSNCVNSEIYNVGVLTQYLPLSLHDHIGIGKPWDLDRRIGGVTLLQPYTGRKGGWYLGTAHAVYQNLNFIKKHNPKYVIVLSGDHVYKMNYNDMINHHIKTKADLTIATQRVEMENAQQFGILSTNDNMKITDFEEKPNKPASNLASMGIYVFTTEVLINKLEKNCSSENSDFGHHIIPEMIDNNNVFAYEYGGYWRDVGTLKSFWETNLALTRPIPELNLYDEQWEIHTNSKEEPPVKLGADTKVISSLVSNGSIINGVVENSIISPGVMVEEGAVVKDSIIFNDTVIKKNSTINRCIIDKNVTIGENSYLGFGDDLTPNDEKPQLLNNGLTVVAKGVNIDKNMQIARNCRILTDVSLKYCQSRRIDSGETVRRITAEQEENLLNLAR